MLAVPLALSICRRSYPTPTVRRGPCRTRTASSGFERSGQGRLTRSIYHTCAGPNASCRLVAKSVWYVTSNAAIEPIVKRELPIGGQRFEGILPPVVTGAAFFDPQSSGARVRARLIMWQPDSQWTAEQVSVLEQAVIERQNILIVA